MITILRRTIYLQKTCLMKLLSQAMLLLVVLALLAAVSLGLNQSEPGTHSSLGNRGCPVPDCPEDFSWCKGGHYTDLCGCRKCKKVELETCGSWFTGFQGFHGICDDYLNCVKGVCRGAPCPKVFCPALPENCKGGGNRDRCGCRVCAKVRKESCGQQRDKHHGYCDIGLRCYNGVCNGLGCPRIACRDPTNCKGGIVRGRCCNECAKVEGETCNHREVTDQGTCDAGLECREGVCKPFRSRRDCFPDTFGYCRHRESLLNCKGGKVKLPCSCAECAKVEGETCGFKGWNYQGKCDSGLACNTGICKRKYPDPGNGNMCNYKGVLFPNLQIFFDECRNICFCELTGRPICFTKNRCVRRQKPELLKPMSLKTSGKKNA